MVRDNVIWVDFRLSKDIRDHRMLSYEERLMGSSALTQEHIQATKSAIELIKLMLDKEPSVPKRDR